MAENIIEKLLSDRRVIEEINRHLWLESEKAGFDIGFEKAKEDWLKKFSKAWMQYHMPEELTKGSKAPFHSLLTEKIVSMRQNSLSKKRRAKSYF